MISINLYYCFTITEIDIWTLLNTYPMNGNHDDDDNNDKIHNHNNKNNNDIIINDVIVIIG